MAKIDLAKIQVALVRFVQFCFFVFYIYAGLVYVGMVLLVPLGAFYHLFNLLHFVLPGVLAGPLALAIVGGAGYVLYGVPRLVNIVQEAGFKLAELAMGQLHDLGAIARSLRDGAPG
jgi:hypothetical protein